MNLYKAHSVDIWFINSAWTGLKASTDTNLLKLFGSSSIILGPKYAKEFNPYCTVFIVLQ